MKKAKERLDAEAAHPMTRKQRLSNFWFYHRWHVLGGGAALILLGTFVYDMASQVQPDYQVALLSSSYIVEDRREALEQFLNTQIDDRNGDGKVAASVVVYQLPKTGESPSDPNTQMANMTRFSADLQSGETMLFLSDSAADYQSQFQCFLYNDGSMPVEGEAVQADQLGVPLVDCPPLAQIADELGLEDFVLMQRVVWPETLERKPELAEQQANGVALYNKLTSR